MIKMSAFVIPLLLVGCSSITPTPAPDDVKPYAEVIPVTQTLSLNGDASHIARSKIELAKFVNEFYGQIQTKSLLITTYSDDGKLLHDYAKEYLNSIGVTENRIQWLDLANAYNPLQRFDFSISLTEYKVQIPACQPSQIGHYYEAGNCCAIESARMKSMVNPEAMLDKNTIKHTN